MRRRVGQEEHQGRVASNEQAWQDWRDGRDGTGDGWSRTIWSRWFGFPRRAYYVAPAPASFTWTVDARAPGTLGAWSRLSTFAAPSRAAACNALGSLAAELGGLDVSVTAWTSGGRVAESHVGSLYQVSAELGCAVGIGSPDITPQGYGGIGSPDIFPWWSGSIGSPDIFLERPWWGRGGR